MGIEHIIVNLDKKEFLDFDRLGFGAKIGSMTSEPIASFLSWMLINPAGYGDEVRGILGRWDGDQIETIGDEGGGEGRQEEARRQFEDIAVEAIKRFADGDRFAVDVVLGG